nr:hypothetical protein [Tanacetum cinerariifolium]
RFSLQRHGEAREVIRAVEAELVGIVQEATPVGVINAGAVAVGAHRKVVGVVARVHDYFVGVHIEQVIDAHRQAHLLEELVAHGEVRNPLGREHLVEVSAGWVLVFGLHLTKAYAAGFDAELIKAVAVVGRFFLPQRLHSKAGLRAVAHVVAHDGAVIVGREHLARVTAYKLRGRAGKIALLQGRCPEAIADGTANGKPVDNAKAGASLAAHIAAKIAVALGPAGQMHQQPLRDIAF